MSDNAEGRAKRAADGASAPRKPIGWTRPKHAEPLLIALHDQPASVFGHDILPRLALLLSIQYGSVSPSITDPIQDAAVPAFTRRCSFFVQVWDIGTIMRSCSSRLILHGKAGPNGAANHLR